MSSPHQAGTVLCSGCEHNAVLAGKRRGFWGAWRGATVAHAVTGRGSVLQ